MRNRVSIEAIKEENLQQKIVYLSKNRVVK